MATAKLSPAAQLAAEVNKALGTSAVILGNDPKLTMSYVPTGILPIDVILGGGIPRNRIIELYGQYSSLKTLIALSACASAQRMGGIAAYIDTEHSYEEAWARSLGVDTDNLIYQMPDTGEEAMDIAQTLILNGIDMLVWDSVAGTLPQQEASKRMHKESIQPGRQAALMSQGLRRLISSNERTAMIFCNQVREKIGITYGSPETTPGGRALPFYAAARIHLNRSRGDTEDVRGFDGSDVIKSKRIRTWHIRAKLEKSKINVPGGEYVFTYDVRNSQVDDTSFLISYALEHGLITQEGQSWQLGRHKPVRGKEAFKKWLTSNPQLVADLKAKAFASPDGKTPGSAGSAKVDAQKPKLRLKKA